MKEQQKETEQNIEEINDETVTEQIEADVDTLEKEAEVDPQQVEIEQLQSDVKELEDKLLRAQAEIQNIQQRHARELQTVRKYDGQKLAGAVLPAVDNL